MQEKQGGGDLLLTCESSVPIPYLHPQLSSTPLSLSHAVLADTATVERGPVLSAPSLWQSAKYEGCMELLM